MAEFGVGEAEKLLEDMFAPWVHDLDLKIISFEDGTGRFVLPLNPRLSRGGGILCGQAIAAAADTVSVLALSAFNGRFRTCTTVDLTSHFMRPLAEADTEISVEALSNGRRMAVTRVEFRSAGGGKLAASATCAFAYLED